MKADWLPQVRICVLVLAAVLSRPDLMGQRIAGGARTVVLTGIVRDERGRVVEGVIVTAALAEQALTAVSESRPRAGHRTVTNAHGEYRLSDLTPGTYVAFVRSEHRTRSLPGVPDCVLSAPLVAGDFEYAEPVEIEPVTALIDRTHRFELAVTPGLTPPPAADGLRASYLTTFAPDAVSFDQATRMPLADGTVGRADITLQLHPSVTLRGRVLGQGLPERIWLQLHGSSATATTITQPDHAFVFMDVPVGVYRLSAETTDSSCDVFGRSDRWEAGGDVSVTHDLDAATILLGVPNPVGTAALMPGSPLSAESRASGSGTIAGRVTTNGRGLDRVRLRLDDEQGTPAGSTVAADDGSFAFFDLVPGTYTLTASRDGYADIIYGQTRWLGEGTPIDVDLDASVRADIAMSRFGTITGRVVDERGRPIENANVWAPFESTTTDADGRYRLTDVVEGQQVIKAWPPTPDGSLDVDYPNASQVQATRRRVMGGEETIGVDFRLRLPPAAQVEVRLHSASKATPNGVILTRPGYYQRPMFMEKDLVRFERVPAGHYRIVAWAEDGDTAAREIDTDGATPTSTTVEFSPMSTATVTARVVFDGPSPHPSRLEWSVSAVTAAREWATIRGGGRALAEGDRGFITPPIVLVGGRYVARVSPEAPRWVARSAMVDGRDALDEPIEIVPQQAREIVVTMTDRPSKLKGIVTDPRGRPMAEADVIVFSADKRFWTARSRRIRIVRPRSDGAYEVTGLPAGVYNVVATNGLVFDEKTDVAFFDAISSLATRVEIAEGREITQALDVRPHQVRLDASADR
jgi:protocatechuate 3,4-dioxygenase beta subunit